MPSSVRFICVFTLPGIMLRSILKLMFCRLLRADVLKIAYMENRPPYGYVEYRLPESRARIVMLICLPILAQSLIAAIVAACAYIPLFVIINYNPLRVIPLYFAFAIGANAFPSRREADILWRLFYEKEKNVMLKAVGIPFAALIWTLTMGDFLWLNCFYGAAITLFVPYAMTFLPL